MLPVAEIGRIRQVILHDQVLDLVLQGGGPEENAFDTSRIRRNNSNRSEGNATLPDGVEHRIEPAMRHFTGTGAHVRQDDRNALVQNIDKGIEPFGGVDVHFTCVREVMWKRAASLFSVSRSSSTC